MKNYTVYCKDEDGYIEEIDLQAKDYYDAKNRARQVIKDEYCNSLVVVEIVNHEGCWL